MKEATTLALGLLAFILTTHVAYAQLELGESGTVGVGISPDSDASIRSHMEGSGGLLPWPFPLYGLDSYASDGQYIAAVYGEAHNGSNLLNAPTFTIGLQGEAFTNSNGGAYGGRFYAHSYANGNAYGIYSSADADGSGQGYAGYFSGDVHVTGSLTQASDRKFKQQIRGLGEISDASIQGGTGKSAARAKLLQLRPVKYRFKQGTYEQMGFPEGEQFGLVAQEVEKVFPELVSEEVHPGREEINDEGKVISIGESTRYKSVNYMQLIPIMVQAIQEQQTEIDVLRSEVEVLKAALERQGLQVE